MNASVELVVTEILYIAWHRNSLKTVLLWYILFPLVKLWIGLRMSCLPFFSELQLLFVIFKTFQYHFLWLGWYTYYCCSDTFLLWCIIHSALWFISLTCTMTTKICRWAKQLHSHFWLPFSFHLVWAPHFCKHMIYLGSGFDKRWVVAKFYVLIKCKKLWYAKYYIVPRINIPFNKMRRLFI